MGTLFQQLPRTAHVNGNGRLSQISWIREIAREMGYTGENLSPEQWHAVCDVARTSLAVQNADTMDEQLAGFGEIFKELVEAVQMLAPSE
jgi:hypothetical protein